MMIRLWAALTSEEDRHNYVEHFGTHVIPALQRLDGYAGAALSMRRTESGIEILVITRLKSLDAVRAFAGDDIERAVVAGEGAQVLKTWDTRVRHYETIIEDTSGG